LRLLFIDFDGVLHPLRDDADASEWFCWLPELTRLVMPYADVRLAVHSTWRYLYQPDELHALLGPLGARAAGSVPRGPREESILWFADLAGVRRDRFCILDDDGQAFSVLGAPELILCDPQRGLSDAHVQRALAAWLSGSAE